MSSQINYVIYVRKSTDDWKWEHQAQSIPDQIKICTEYAKNNGLTIMKKPSKFEFETEADIREEDNDKDLVNRRIFKETRWLYIVKEKKSAKIPWKREKWMKIIKKIRNWEIQWLLSYSPDRQARNMVEWWDLIDCVDCNLVDLKYTNFHFENTASWKMMLWIWFVFSKQYSDKLSEDVNRWIQSRVSKWMAQWEYKYWYTMDENKYFVPDWKNFELMQEAFRLKVEKKASDAYVADWLNAHWFERKSRNQKEWMVNPKWLSQVWIDEFYYGVYIHGKNVQDLREIEHINFKPMITKEWHDILVERYERKQKEVWIKKSERKDEYAYSLPAWLVTVPDWYHMTTYITKKKERLEQFEKLKKSNPTLKLEDFIKSKNVRYEIRNHNSKHEWLSINQDEIEEAIYKKLCSLSVSPKAYDKYVDFVKYRLDDINTKNTRLQKSLDLQLSNIREEKKNFIKWSFWRVLNSEEDKIYKEALNDYERQEESIQQKIIDLWKSERDQFKEFEIVAKSMQNAGNYYKKASNVQKKKICQILLSNVNISVKRVIRIKINPWLETLFHKNSNESGGEGIEPPTAVPKTDVLPLHQPPVD